MIFSTFYGTSFKKYKTRPLLRCANILQIEESQPAQEAIAIVIDLTSHFPHQLIFLETKFKGTYYSHNFKITFAAKRSNLSGELLPLDTKLPPHNE